MPSETTHDNRDSIAPKTAKLMEGHGGFEHNAQSLRIVEELEGKYPGFKGLNLTFEVREGIVKHRTEYDKAKVPQELEPNSMPTLEAQIVDIADEIAYDNHDLDDGLASGLIQENCLEKISFWHEAGKEIEGRHPGIGNPKKRYQIIRRLIAILVDDCITESRARLEKNNISSIADVRQFSTRLIDFSDGLKEKRKPLREFLQTGLYRHYRVNRMSDKARRFIRKLFCAYIDNTSMLPEELQGKISESCDKYNVVCDYIASMTDRYALDEYEKLFNPYKKV